jgi:amino acid adenylation domain-containing protein
MNAVSQPVAATLPAADDFNPFASGSISRVAATTQPQREVWLADKLSEEASLAYNESITLRLRGPLDVAALQAAVRDVIAAHESLRSTFSADGQQMIVGDTLVIDVPVHAGADAATLERACTRAVGTRFDLENGPLVRAELLAFSAEDHALVFTAHHIVCDGWSFGVIVRDLAAAYAARREGGPALAAGDSFATYADAEARHAGSEAQRDDETYWLSRYASGAPTLDLPTDRARRAWRSFSSRRTDIVLDAALTADVRRFGAKLGAGLPATLTGAFATLLHRISGSTSVVVGLPAAGQSQADQSRLVGHCVNLLPLRFDIDGDQTVADVIKDARSQLLDAFEHQRYTFGTLLQKLAVKRDPGRLPLVSVLFNVDQALDGEAVRFPGLSFEFHANPRVAENFELFVNAVPMGAELRLEVQYNADLFDESTIRRWFDAYLTLLRSALADGARRVALLDLVSPEALRDLANLQPPVTAYERDVLMHEFIERQVDRTPDATALVFGTASLSYAALDRRANQFAHALRAAGVRRGVNVGLCLSRSLDMVAAIVGILKAGGTHVPLDPAFPAERLSFMTSDAALGALISESEHVDKLGVARERTLLLDQDEARIAAQPETRLARDGDAGTPQTSAYIIYTSGSTGRPKGVQVPHGAIANLFASLTRAPGIEARDTLVAVTTISFDIAIFELMLPLTVGARVVVAARDQVRDAGALRALLESCQATIMQATPAGWRILLESGWEGHRGFKAISGGEPLAPDLANALLKRCSSVWNGYGPTETTVYSTFWPVANVDRGISIGKPVANTTVWILDERQRLVPQGVPGEICIGGEGVTLGYLNRPELDAERYLPNTFDDRGGRVYRTGDRGRWLASGTLEHLGRLDFQVKVRGYRVELGEIEANLLTLPTVARAVAMAREDRAGDVRLVAYVVAQPGASLDEAALRAHVSRILPEYFVPQHFLVLPQIPLLPNGKVDRKALPAPEAPTSRREYSPPRNDLEKSVASVFEQVLGLPGVGIDDDFFALGGHSLLAAQLTARLNRELGVKLTLRSLFDAPTIARLAEKIESERSAGNLTREAPIGTRQEQRKAPLSIMQERLWFLEQLHPGRVVYNTPSAHRLRGTLDLAAFERAFAEMVAHQPSLRTSILVESSPTGISGPQQLIHENVPLALTPEDLSSLPASERETKLMERLDALTNEPFDLTRPPLFRARLFRLAAEEHVLLFVPHHMIWDGWSFDLFYDELAQVYEAFRAGKPSPLKPLPISYGDFAAWHRDWLKGPDFARQIGFWRERLATVAEVAELPADKPRRPGMSGEGCTEWISIDKATTEALRELSKQADTTLFMTLLTLYYVLLARVSGRKSLVVGTPVRGRNLPEVERVMGYFTNLLPLHLTVDRNESFLDLLKRVKACVLESFASPDVPLEMLMRELTVQRGEGGSLLYQALFSFQDARHRAANWGGLEHQQILLFQRGATEDLGLWFLDNDRGMVGGITYNADIIGADSARLLRDRYLKLVNEVLAAADTPVGRLNLELESDTRQARALAGPIRQHPGSLQALFESAVDRDPGAPAALVGGWSVSYQELEAQANRIAHALIARGAVPGTVVALCEEPGQGFLAGLLGILKTGAACLLLDPGVATARATSALSIARAMALVGNSRFRDVAGELALKTLWLDGDAAEIAQTAVTRPVLPGNDNGAAVLLDLVGSPMAPRIVTLSHATLVNAVCGLRDAVGLTAQHRCLASGALSAETTVLEWLLPWSAGAAAVVVKTDVLRDLGALRRELEAGVGFLNLPTETWAALLALGWRPSADLIGLVYGERPTLELAEQLGASGKLYRAWGFAEAGGWVTLSRVERAEDALLLGRPLDHVRVEVRDEQRLSCPVNVWGELHIHVPGQNGEGPRVYGRWRADGRLERQTQADDAVFAANTRIDLRAFEQLLLAQAGVDDAHCVLRFDGAARPVLVAYVAGSEPDLRSRLREVLAGQTPPVLSLTEVITLGTLPRTPDGRIDARALPQGEAEPAQRDEHVAPSTDKEKMLAEIWCDLLGLPQVSTRHNFFDLGGHSLLAMQAIATMEKKTGRQIAARRYMFQTLAQLAASYDEPVPEAPPKPGLVGRLLGALRGNRGK